MKFITYPTLLILVFLFLHNKIIAQNKNCTIEFAVQDSTNLNLKNINCLQALPIKRILK